MPRRWVFSLLVAVSVLTGPPARADLIQLFSPDDLDPSSLYRLAYPGPVGATRPSPYTLAVGTFDLTYTLPSGVFTVVNDGFRNFLYNNATGPLQIDFSHTATEFAIQALNAPSASPDQTFEMSVFLSGTLLGTFSKVDPTTAVSFLGVRAISGQTFDRVVISSNTNDFAVCDAAIGPIPEPGTVLLVAIGLAFLASGRIRGRRTHNGQRNRNASKGSKRGSK